MISTNLSDLFYLDLIHQRLDLIDVRQSRALQRDLGAGCGGGVTERFIDRTSFAVALMNKGGELGVTGTGEAAQGDGGYADFPHAIAADVDRTVLVQRAYHVGVVVEKYFSTGFD